MSELTEDLKSKISQEIISPAGPITVHDDVVRSWAEKTLAQTIPWEGYHRANLILEREQDLIKKYDKKSEEQRNQLIQREGETYCELFMDLLVKINKEETLQYLLTLVDQLLKEHPECVTIFLKLSSKNPAFPFDPFIRLLSRSNLDWYTQAKASIVLATLISKSGSVTRTTSNLMDGTIGGAPVLSEENIKFVCQWVREQLRKVDEKEQCNGIAALQKILRNEALRVPYAQEDGLHLLGNLLKTKVKNFQIVYQSVQCLWLLSFQKSVAEQITSTRIIHNLVEILKVVPKEKVIRMTLATLRNLLNVGSNNDLMIDSGILKPLEVLTAKNWGDEDIVDDLTALNDALQRNMVILSSFEMYKKEVLSGNLEWSPVHRSEKFWRENAHRLEEDNNKLLLVLKEILTSASDNQVLCIACYDVGEFARFHPRGKVLLQQTGLKLALMKLMEDKDSEIKKHALLAVQKLMVTNWEYLSA